MKKIKITDSQRIMLESKANAKLKLTEDIAFSQSPSAKVTGEFKKAKIAGFKAESANTPQTNNNVNWNELVTNVHEFLKQIYTNPTKEGLNPYWNNLDITWDDLIQMLTAVGMIKSVSGGYRLTKVVDNPTKAIKIVAKLVEKMVKDKQSVPVEEVMSSDDIKKSLSNQLAPKPKTGKTRAELLAVIAAKRKEELDRREAEKQRPIGEDNSNIPVGTQDHLGAPEEDSNVRQGIRPKNKGFNIVWYHQDIAIFERGGKYYAFNVDSADNDEYAEYVDREEMPMGRDEDGVMDVEYGDWDMSDDIVYAYVNNNIDHLSIGKGINDWERGVELVEIDRDMADDFMSLARFIKGPIGEKLANILSSINLEEVTSTGSVGGSYVGKLEGGPQSKYPSNVGSEMKKSIDEVDSNGPLKLEIIASIKPFIVNSPDSSMLFWISHESKLKEIVDKIQSLDNDEWALMIQFIVKALQGAETYIEEKKEEGISMFKHSIIGLSKFVSHFSQNIGEATTTTSVGGDSGTFAYDAPVGDGNDFWTAGNKMNKKTVKEDNKAFKDTQYPNGGFVEIDKCAKIGHNDKTAIKGGCSTGAVDNVVKTKTTKNSIISDESIYETISKQSGRTIEDVKRILSTKIYHK